MADVSGVKSKVNPFISKLGGKDYVLGEICPNAVKMAHDIVKEINASYANSNIDILEVGTGCGDSILPLLESNPNCSITSIDQSEKMVNTAKKKLAQWICQGKIKVVATDALEYLRQVKSESVDVITSVYTIHNFTHEYREQFLHETYRILKKNGLFINADRFAIDDTEKQTIFKLQEEQHYKATLTHLGRSDLIHDWIEHLHADYKADKIMYHDIYMVILDKLGFNNIRTKLYYQSIGVDRTVAAFKVADAF